MADAQSLPTDPVAGLIDIPLPPAVSLWPQTWAARGVIVVVAVALIAGAWWLVRRWWENRYRRAALTELSRLEQVFNTSQATDGVAGKLALLVRRTALAAFPREQVAALAGPAWLSFLDGSYGGTEFTQGAGRLLETEAYGPAREDASRLGPLIDLVRRWIKVHHA